MQATIIYAWQFEDVLEGRACDEWRRVLLEFRYRPSIMQLRLSGSYKMKLKIIWPEQVQQCIMHKKFPCLGTAGTGHSQQSFHNMKLILTSKKIQCKRAELWARILPEWTIFSVNYASSLGKSPVLFSTRSSRLESSAWGNIKLILAKTKLM